MLYKALKCPFLKKEPDKPQGFLRLFWQSNCLLGFVSMVVGFLGGCVHGSQSAPTVDPYEDMNRAIFSFNQTIDKGVYRPVAKTYDVLTPYFVKKGLRNFFSNVEQVTVILNDVLQFNLPWLMSDISGFVLNTTLGIGGLFDVAHMAGLQKHPQDFGLTLAKWGVRTSPYLQVPFLGPFTFRDLIGSTVDTFPLYPWTYVGPTWVAYGIRGYELIDLRARLLSTDKLIDQAFDPYLFVRDAYLQNRKAKVDSVIN